MKRPEVKKKKMQRRKGLWKLKQRDINEDAFLLFNEKCSLSLLN